MNSFTFNSNLLFKALVVVLALAGLAYGNHLTMDLVPDKEALKAAKRLVEPEKTPNLLILGNSTMYKNLGGSSALIDQALSQRLGRKVHARMLVGDGIRSDWLYVMLKEIVIPEHKHLPIIWFYWTGMAFEPGIVERSSLLRTANCLDTSTEASSSLLASPRHDIANIGHFLRQHLALFRVAPLSSVEFRRTLQNALFAAFSGLIPQHASSAEEVLRATLREINPLHARAAVVPGTRAIPATDKISVEEDLSDFPGQIASSIFPSLDRLIKENHLSFYFLEVTTKSILEDGFDNSTHFNRNAMRSKEVFEAYREKQNEALRGYGYRPLSLIGHPELKLEHYEKQLYLKPSFYPHFAAAVADIVVGNGILGEDDSRDDSH